MASELASLDRVGAVSAVVCNYDGERYLARCLDALAALSGGVDEILVVDNASSDGSVAMVAERHPQARVVRMPENLGPAAARNAGMRAARNRWVLALDNDATVTPELLARLRAAANHRASGIEDPKRSLWSSHLEVTIDGSTANFHGRGYGHGVGLCQYGAETLARDETTHRDILGWYYPGAELVKAY